MSRHLISLISISFWGLKRQSFKQLMHTQRWAPAGFATETMTSDPFFPSRGCSDWLITSTFSGVLPAESRFTARNYQGWNHFQSVCLFPPLLIPLRRPHPNTKMIDKLIEGAFCNQATKWLLQKSVETNEARFIGIVTCYKIVTSSCLEWDVVDTLIWKIPK